MPPLKVLIDGIPFYPASEVEQQLQVIEEREAILRDHPDQPLVVKTVREVVDREIRKALAVHRSQERAAEALEMGLRTLMRHLARMKKEDR